MRVVRYKKFFVFLVTFFLFCTLGPFVGRGLTTHAAWVLSPFWKLFNKATSSFSEHESIAALQQLEAEHYFLQEELRRLQRERGIEESQKAIKAHVIYRDPTSWNSSVWVDVGSQHSSVIAKNSPVLVGKAVVGIVDYVGKKQSRLSLLTDRTLHPSVRSVRGELKNQGIIEHLDVVIRSLAYNKEYAAFFGRIKERLEEEKATLYLAKGFLQGAAAPLWRKRGAQLTGVGFNYDFSDKKGPAQRIDLTHPQALLREGDLLVTTGMDGVFPPDLFVAFVTKVYPLKEGDVSYQIEATPYLSNLDSFKTCTIIAPVECTFDEIVKMQRH